MVNVPIKGQNPWKWEHCCRGRLRDVLADCCTLGLYCETITLQ